MKTYKSKIGFGILIPLIIILSASIVLMIVEKVWIGLFIDVLACTFIGYIYSATYYLVMIQTT